MSQLIDRRQNAGKKSTVNRQRFLRRYKSQIKKAVSEAVGKRSITEIDQGEQITIPAKDIYEPQFHRAMEAISNVYYREMIISSPGIG